MSSSTCREGRVPRCPDCGTELTKVRGRRRGTGYLHCWKCDRPMRPGEVRAAKEAARARLADMERTA